MKFSKLFNFIKSLKSEEDRFMIEYMASKKSIKRYVLDNKELILESMPKCNPVLALTVSASMFLSLADSRYKPFCYKSFNEDGDTMYWAYLANIFDRKRSIVIDLNNYDNEGIVMYFSDEPKLYDNEGNSVIYNNLEILEHIRCSI